MTDSPSGARAGLARWKIVLLAALFAAPPLVAYVLYQSGWRSERTLNHGELVQPARPLDDVALATLEGRPHRLLALRGKWTLVYFGPAECLKPCIDNLYKMRQVHLAQGKDMERVQRVFIVTDPKALDLLRDTLKDYPGTLVLTGESDAIGQVARQFAVSAGSPLDNLHRLYLVDPLGNFMMSYPADADPTGLRKDLVRLLRVSRVG
jgi:cytochrome oxidase Cu insertion factor (SCO1/SenC/PrrC family)